MVQYQGTPKYHSKPFQQTLILTGFFSLELQGIDCSSINYIWAFNLKDALRGPSSEHYYEDQWLVKPVFCQHSIYPVPIIYATNTFLEFLTCIWVRWFFSNSRIDYKVQVKMMWRIGHIYTIYYQNQILFSRYALKRKTLFWIQLLS